MKIDILTIFPEMFSGVFSSSMLRIAREKGLLTVNLVDFREYSQDKHKKVDDRPYGGGPGMILQIEPIYLALQDLLSRCPEKPRLILTTPQGKPFTQRKAEEFSRLPYLVFVCGHYEGYDERLHQLFDFDEISVGDYVLTGGELPAMTMLDAAVRLIPGVLGEPGSVAGDSFTTGLLDYPQYTRPPVFLGLPVPAVLASGDHAAVARWRDAEARQRTRDRRPDLMAMEVGGKVETANAKGGDHERD